MSETETTEIGWCVIELMGHRRLCGYVTEQEIAGGAFIRLDIPETDRGPAVTQYYSTNAVYCITPTTEEIARAAAALSRPAPVSPFELAPVKPRVLVESDDDALSSGDEDYDDIPVDRLF